MISLACNAFISGTIIDILSIGIITLYTIVSIIYSMCDIAMFKNLVK